MHICINMQILMHTHSLIHMRIYMHTHTHTLHIHMYNQGGAAESHQASCPSMPRGWLAVSARKGRLPLTSSGNNRQLGTTRPLPKPRSTGIGAR